MKNIENITKELLLKGAVEDPSRNFTSNVMEHILSEDVSQAITYQPVISKTGWMVAAAIFIGFLITPFIAGNNISGETSSITTQIGDHIEMGMSFFSTFITGISISPHIWATVFGILLLASIDTFIGRFGIKSMLKI